MVDADFKEEDTLGIQNPLLSPAPLGQEWLQPQFLSPLGAVSLLGIYRISGLQPEPEIESISSNNSLAISSLNQENSVQDWRTSKATDNSSKVRTNRTVPIQRKLVQNVETIADHKSEVQPNTHVAQYEIVDFSIEPKAEIVSAEVDQPKLIQQEITQRSEAITPDIQSVAELIAHSNPETRQVNQNENIDFIVKRNSTSVTDSQPELIQREAIQKSEEIAHGTQEAVKKIAYVNSESSLIKPPIPDESATGFETELKIETSPAQAQVNDSLIQREIISSSKAFSNTSNPQIIAAIAQSSPEIKSLADQKLSSPEGISKNATISSNNTQSLNLSDASNQTIPSTPGKSKEGDLKNDLDSQSSALKVDEVLMQRTLDIAPADQISRSPDNESSIQTYEVSTQPETDSIQIQRSTLRSPDLSEIALHNFPNQTTGFQQKEVSSLENEIAVTSALADPNSKTAKDTVAVELSNVSSIKNVLQSKPISPGEIVSAQAQIASDQVTNSEIDVQLKFANLKQEALHKSSRIEILNPPLLGGLQTEVTIQQADWERPEGWSVLKNVSQPSPNVQKFAPSRQQNSIPLPDVSDIIQRQTSSSLEQSKSLDESASSNVTFESSGESSFDDSMLENSIQRSLEISSNQPANLSESQALDKSSISPFLQADSFNVQKLESATLSEETEAATLPSHLEVPSLVANSAENLISQPETFTDDTRLIENEVLQEKTSALSEGLPGSKLQLKAFVPDSKSIISEQGSLERSKSNDVTLLNCKELDNYSEVTNAPPASFVESNLPQAIENDRLKEEVNEPAIAPSKTSQNPSISALQTTSKELNSQQANYQNLIQFKLKENQSDSSLEQTSTLASPIQKKPEGVESETTFSNSNNSLDQASSSSEKSRSEVNLSKENTITPVARSLRVLESLAQLQPINQTVNLQRSSARTHSKSSHSSNLFNSSQAPAKGHGIIQRSPSSPSSERVNSTSIKPLPEQQNSRIDVETYSSLVDLQAVQTKLRKTRLVQTKSANHPTNDSPIQNSQIDKSQASIEFISSEQDLPSSWSNLSELAGEAVSSVGRNSKIIQRSTNSQPSSKSKDLIFTPEGFHNANTEKTQSVKSSRSLLKVDQQKPLIQAKRNPNAYVSPVDQNILEETIDLQSDTQTIDESAQNFDHNLQILAQVIYGQLQQQLAIRRERQGQHSGRLPW
ncbi:hypothetical protein [Phormidesmis sp. 146-33]